MFLNGDGIPDVEVPRQLFQMARIRLIRTLTGKFILFVIIELQVVGRIKLVRTRPLFGDAETERCLQALHDSPFYIEVVRHVQIPTLDFSA